MSSDAIVMLKDDHTRVRKPFRDFQAAGDGAKQAKNQLVTRILEELTVHTYLENEVMYPEVRRLVPDLEDDILESYEEHHVADVLCFELSTMDADDERFVPSTPSSGEPPPQLAAAGRGSHGWWDSTGV